MSTDTPAALEPTATSRSYIARRFGSPTMATLDFEEWMAAAWCSEETIRRLSGV